MYLDSYWEMGKSHNAPSPNLGHPPVALLHHPDIGLLPSSGFKLLNIMFCFGDAPTKIEGLHILRHLAHVHTMHAHPGRFDL